MKFRVTILTLQCNRGTSMNGWFFMRWRHASWPLGAVGERGGVVAFDGISYLPRKSLLNPSWRWRWPHRLLRAEGDVPYYVYFRCGSVCMRTWWLVYTPIVAVRIGPDFVTFCAVDEAGNKVSLVPLGNAQDLCTPI